MAAASSKPSQASLLKTWERFHYKWFSEDVPTFPIYEFALRAVASQFKRAGYRSFSNYLSAAKKFHVKAGYVWDQLLDATGRDCVRSVNRGIGPAKQAAALDLDAVHALHLEAPPLIDEGVFNPGDTFELGCFFLTREVELAVTTWSNFEVGEARVSWRLSASKTDPTAISVTRHWECICSDSGSRPCAFHAAARHRQRYLARFGDLPPDGFVFPVWSGRPATKLEMIETFEAIASRIGLPLQDPLGRRAVTGHSARVTGARHLAQMGLELYKLALLARWSSPVILRYVSEAPLRTISDDCRKLLAGSSLDQVLRDLAKKKVQASDSGMAIGNLKQAINELDQRVNRLALKGEFGFLKNLVSGVHHRVAFAQMGADRRLWTTTCGWSFASSGARYRMLSELGSTDEHAVCDRCNL